jgi:nitroimidazol reductase NimA-like FMN-containing flavoprotein (pyridoxamine 5'-phosphate oxidase superfamily)
VDPTPSKWRRSGRSTLPPVALRIDDDVVEIDRNGFEVLDREECLRLVASTTLGRVGVSHDALPTVIPVDFRLDGERIYLRPRTGSKLEAALRDTVVAFEVDDVEPESGVGWSVIATGIATVLHGDERERALTRWPSATSERVVAISTERITGRRAAASATDATTAMTTTRGGGVMTDAGHKTGLQTLHREDCCRLLAAEEIGRLAVNEGGVPAIFPVNYHFDGAAVVFRTDPGTKLTWGPRAPACFEIDAFDGKRRTGWSVVVAGQLEELSPYDTQTQRQVTSLPFDPWAGGEKAHWIRLHAERITGRYVGDKP